MAPLKNLPPFPSISSPDAISALAKELAPSLNGIWTVDLKQSDSISEFIGLMGAPWAVVKLIQIGGEPSATRTFLLTETGLEDTIDSKGALGNRKDYCKWLFEEFSRINPMGMPPSPSLLWIDSEKRLVLMAHNLAKGLRISTTFHQIVTSEDRKIDTLVAYISVTDADGKEVLKVKRVMTRIRT